MSYAYDALNRLETVTDWDGGLTEYGYDTVGRLTHVSRPNGVTSAYAYDDAGRLTLLSHSTLTQTLSSYAYALDRVGNRVQVTQTLAVPLPGDTFLESGGLAVIEAEHFSQNITTTHQAWITGTAWAGYAGTAYVQVAPDLGALYATTVLTGSPELQFQVSFVTTGAYTVWLYGAAPDAAGDSVYVGLADQVASVSGFAPRQWGWGNWEIGELESGEAATVTVGAPGLYTLHVWAREDGLRLDRLLLAADSGYEPAGHGPAESPRVGAGGEGQAVVSTTEITYVYDPLSRLTGAAYSSGETYTYTYDAVGNRLQLTEHGTRITHYEYDAADRLTAVDGVGYTYDDNGNLLSDGARTFSYDTANRLTQVVSGTFTTEYTYAGDGTRLAQTVNGVTTRYVNDVAAPLAQVLEEQRPGHTTRYLTGVGLETDGQWSYQHADALGSVRQLSDPAGQVLQARGYTPFGQTRYAVGQPAGSFGFAGEQHDAASGLIYLRARYYDPAVGRFLTRDVFPALATAPQSLHRYAYCGNDPVNRTDPSGQWWWDDLARDARHAWNRLTRPLRGVESWLEDTAQDTERKVLNWRYDPQRETARVLSTTGQALTRASDKAWDFVDRKGAELNADVRQTTAAWERGDKEAAIGHGAGYLLHFSGLTDVRLTRNIIKGETTRVYESVQQFNYHRGVVLDPRQQGTDRWWRSMGEMSFTGFDLATRGGASDVRYGLQEGDYLRAAAGAAQVFPLTKELRLAGDALDLAVAGREVYRGLEAGNWEQVEMGAFMAAVNLRQIGSGGVGDVASQLERPALHVRPAHLVGDVLEKAVGSIVPGGDLALRGGRRVLQDLRTGDEFGHIGLRQVTAEGTTPRNRALVPYDAEFAAWQARRLPDDAGEAAQRAAVGIRASRTPGIYRYSHKRDAAALRQFAADAFEYNQLGKNPTGRRMGSFGGLWASWADTADVSRETAESLSRNLFVYYGDDDSIVGALRTSGRVRKGALLLDELESIRPGIGTELLKEGVRESLSRGLGGRIFYYSAEDALPYHRKLAAFTGAINTDDVEFYYDSAAAVKLLDYATKASPVFYPPRLLSWR